MARLSFVVSIAHNETRSVHQIDPASVGEGPQESM